MNNNQNDKITDVSIYIAGLQATYRPAPVPIGSPPMKSILPLRIWILQPPLLKSKSFGL
jgi:hypothetical protein